MKERYRILRNSDEVSELTGIAFEEYLAELFQVLGYRTIKTPASGDFGADILLEKEGVKTVLQAKQYSSSVGFDAVKEAYFALGYYEADEAWVVTTSDFTQQATNAADKMGIRLVPGRELDKLILASKEEESPNLTDTGTGSAERIQRINSTTETREERSSCCQLEETAILLNGLATEKLDNVVSGYNGSSSIIETPAGALAIGDSAFSRRECTREGLKQVIIHEGIRIIGDAAFLDCANLRFVQLPSTLEAIGDNAFKGCTSLSSVKFPDRLRSIGSRAFEDTGISDLVLPGSVSQVGEGAFSSCSVINAVWSPGAKLIPNNAFSGCERLREMTLPNGLKSIGAEAFANTGMSTIVLPDSLEEIRGRAFMSCTSLEDAPIPMGVKRICRSAFFGCAVLRHPDLDDITLSSKVVEDVYDPHRQYKRIRISGSEDRIVSGENRLFYTDNSFEKADYVIEGLTDGFSGYAVVYNDEPLEGNDFLDDLVAPDYPQLCIPLRQDEKIRITLDSGDSLFLCGAAGERQAGYSGHERDAWLALRRSRDAFENSDLSAAASALFDVDGVIESHHDDYFDYKRAGHESDVKWDLRQFGEANDSCMLFAAETETLIACVNLEAEASGKKVVCPELSCWYLHSSLNADRILFKIVKEILNLWLPEMTQSERADYCMFAFDAVYKSATIAYQHLDYFDKKSLHQEKYSGMFMPAEDVIISGKTALEELLAKFLDIILDAISSRSDGDTMLRFVVSRTKCPYKEYFDPVVLHDVSSKAMLIAQRNLSPAFQSKLETAWSTLDDEIARLNQEKRSIEKEIGQRGIGHLARKMRMSPEIVRIQRAIETNQRAKDDVQSRIFEQYWRSLNESDEN